MSETTEDRVLREARALAANFAPYDPDRAIADIRAHIKSFWARPMREALKARLADMPELVRRAAEGL